MRKILLFCAIICAAAFALPNCYEINKIEKKSEINEAVFVLIDETTPFNEPLKEQVVNNVLRFAQAGNYVFAGKFSAFLQGRYNEVLFDFALDTPLSDEERYDLNKNTLAKFDKCLKDQVGFVKKTMSEKINGAFLKEGDQVAKSDIFYALKDFAVNSIAPKEAKNKIVILASDMLENSSVTSFYTKGAPRLIDGKKELGILEKNDLFTDFTGAKIYIVGAGLSEGKKSYVSPQILNSLSAFWSEYFTKSNATLVEMGTPALKREVK